MFENKKTIKLVAKVILITMSVILSGVFVLGVLVYLLGYIFINGTPIYNISNSEEKKFEELYTLYLPDDYEFVKGHASGFSPDMYDEYHFVVDEDDFEDMIGEKWTYVSEGGSWRADFDDESVEAEEGYYEISIHADLFYKVRGDKVDCYLTIWSKYESSLAEE